MAINAKCPRCKSELTYRNEQDIKNTPYFPFCSERCKLIDLGKWAKEEYRVPLSMEEAKENEGIVIPKSFV